MTSLLETKRKTISKSSSFCLLDQERLKDRFDELRENLDKFLKHISNDEEGRDEKRLILIFQTWINEMKDFQSKTFESLDDHLSWLNKNVLKSYELKNILEGVLSQHRNNSQTKEVLQKTYDQIEYISQDMQTKQHQLSELKKKFDDFVKDVGGAMERMKKFTENLSSNDFRKVQVKPFWILICELQKLYTYFI
jgi:hypothetical protein